MKIAFVGKGGSGKSTVSALFIAHLLKNKQHVLAVDADINQHLAELIGAPLDESLALAGGSNKKVIRNYLKGTNQRIKDAQKVIKTTPPGTGSGIITIDADNEIIDAFAENFATNGYFMHVGTYDKDGIGTSCYHSSLSVFENVISHTVTGDKDWLVADMVAGTDAFAGALYLMFDVIFLVVEPSPESVGVYAQFMQLAEEAGVKDRVSVIGNKVIDNDDIEYLKDALGVLPSALIAYDKGLRKARQRGDGIGQAMVPEVADGMAHIQQVAINGKMDPNDQLMALHKLHRHFASQDFTIAKYGNLHDQVDPGFRFKADKRS